MKLEYTFLHIDSSDALVEHFESRFGKLLKFELKPMDVQVVFSMERHECMVDVNILEGRRKFKASGVSNDFYRSVDMVVNKLLRQMSKERRKLRDHKNADASHNGKLNRLQPDLAPDYVRPALRKAS
ncbi:MAG: ribosome-associated translation inhibitor RaiA [Bdellovibrionaceae bacterium]|nr:ribosome-associated translation inhibitor RaiA [Pseudobdellovibrionaceae bacterium]